MSLSTLVSGLPLGEKGKKLSTSSLSQRLKFLPLSTNFPPYFWAVHVWASHGLYRGVTREVPRWRRESCNMGLGKTLSE